MSSAAAKILSDTMQALNVNDSEVEANPLPPAVKNRVDALETLHLAAGEIDSGLKKERIAIEKRRNALKTPIYQNRAKIISGEVEPETNAELGSEGEKGIPEFWFTCLVNHPATTQLVAETDEEALGFLKDVTCEYNEDFTSFRLDFSFAENPFFSNAILSKTYVLSPDILDNQPSVEEVTGTPIEWKESKNLCVKETKKKMKAKSGKNKGQVKIKTTSEPVASFFHYFADPSTAEEDEEEEEDGEEENEDGGPEVGDGDDAGEEENGEENDGEDDELVEEAEEDDDDGIIMPMEVDDSDDDEIEALVKSAALSDDDDEGSDGGSVEDVLTEKSAKKLRTTTEDDDEDEDESTSAGNTRVGGGIFGIGASSMSSQSSTKSSMFQWDDFTPAVVVPPTVSEGAEDGESEDEDAEGDRIGRGKRVRQKATDQRNQEQEIRRRETALADGSLVPESAEDFDRLLLAQPSSSLLWIRYMSFHLLNADVDAARAVGERALRTIGFREEEEKYNVWLALLNLEYKFGTMESLEALFKRAIAESRAKYLHLHLAEQYEKAGDKSGAEAMFERTLKRFKKSKKVWMAYQAFRLRMGDSAAAKALLARSLQSLERHKHLAVLSKYASTEFDIGSISRGREVFEEMVRNYPKKTDIWHVYVDKEVKSGNVVQARKLFERMSGLKTNSKNMQTIFKKHLAFELKYGDEESQTAVKERAREYVEKLL